MKVRLSMYCNVRTPRALYEKLVFGVAGLLNENGMFGSGKGVRKLKKYLLMPRMASLVIVDDGDQRQLIARFFGLRYVSTKFGELGKIGRPPLAESPREFCSPCA